MFTGNLFGNPNIGMYIFATNTYALVGQDMPKKMCEEVEKTLKVPVHKISAAGTSLTGVFFAGNSHCLLVPEIMFQEEIDLLKKAGIVFAVIKSHLTALGNNILANDKGAIVNKEFDDKAIEQIHISLKVPVVRATIAGIHVVGSSAVLNKNGCLIHRDVTEEEKKKVEETLAIHCEECTVNLGNPYLRSGIVCNDYDYILGDNTRGPEVQIIHQTLIDSARKKP